MRDQNLWARHYMDPWQSRAGDPRLPYWLRVAAIAYGRHQDNGHATFKRGQIALILGRPDGFGGVQPYVNVGRAIEDAVQYGWLASESFWGCLVVPSHAVKKGPLGHNPPCGIHSKREGRQQRKPLSQ